MRHLKKGLVHRPVPDKFFFFVAGSPSPGPLSLGTIPPVPHGGAPDDDDSPYHVMGRTCWLLLFSRQPGIQPANHPASQAQTSPDKPSSAKPSRLAWLLKPSPAQPSLAQPSVSPSASFENSWFPRFSTPLQPVPHIHRSPSALSMSCLETYKSVENTRILSFLDKTFTMHRRLRAPIGACRRP